MSFCLKYHLKNMSSFDSEARVVNKRRGIPICGAHVCSMFVMKDKIHLFKWTHESLVEEIEEFQEVGRFLVRKGYISTSETIVKSYEKGIDKMKD
ncbi:hypothetical protein HID58_085216, partial [Brassica napus]